MELLLDALGSCQAIAINAFAPKFKVKIKKLDIHVEGDIDLGGFLGTNSARPGYQRLRSTIDLDADGDPDAVNRLIEYVEAHCPVGALSLTELPSPSTENSRIRSNRWTSLATS